MAVDHRLDTLLDDLACSEGQVPAVSVIIFVHIIIVYAYLPAFVCCRFALRIAERSLLVPFLARAWQMKGYKLKPGNGTLFEMS